MEMKLDFKTTMHESYVNESGKRVTISTTASNRSRTQYYFVTVMEPGKVGETVATRCTYDQAVRIAKEEYSK